MTCKDWQKMSKSERELYYKAYLKGFNAAIKKSYLRQQIADKHKE